MRPTESRQATKRAAVLFALRPDSRTSSVQPDHSRFPSPRHTNSAESPSCSCPLEQMSWRPVAAEESGSGPMVMGSTAYPPQEAEATIAVEAVPPEPNRRERESHRGPVCLRHWGMCRRSEQDSHSARHRAKPSRIHRAAAPTVPIASKRSGERNSTNLVQSIRSFASKRSHFGWPVDPSQQPAPLRAVGFLETDPPRSARPTVSDASWRRSTAHQACVRRQRRRSSTSLSGFEHNASWGSAIRVAFNGTNPMMELAFSTIRMQPLCRTTVSQPWRETARRSHRRKHGRSLGSIARWPRLMNPGKQRGCRETR